VVAGDTVYCSGIIATDPQTGELIAGTFEDQARRALDNLKMLLEDVGTGLSNVVKTTVFLADMKDFATLNKVYAAYFRDEPPARTTVQVAGLPKDAALEIEAVAVLPD